MAICPKNGNKKTLNDYIKLIADNQANSGYITKLKKEYFNEKSSNDIMRNLSLFVPREYFLELQFCAKTIASMFGTIFPPLISHIDQLAYIEWLLYTEPGYTKSRDHLVHMFKVAFVGDRLLSNNNILEKICELQFEAEHFKEWSKDSKFNIYLTNENDQKDIVKMAFILASVFHDFGYGYFFHNLYQGRLFKINKWLQPGSDLTDIDTPFFEKFKKSLPYFYIEQKHKWGIKSKTFINEEQKKRLISGFFRDCLPLNHSIASTFTILDIAERLWDSGALNEKLYVSFQLAAEAIMIHDMTERKNWMHLDYKKKKHFLDNQSYKSIPIAILLILADVLAVWNRFKMKSKHSGNNEEITYQIDNEYVPKEIDIEILDKKIIIKPIYKTPKEKRYYENYDVLGKKFQKDLAHLYQPFFEYADI